MATEQDERVFENDADDDETEELIEGPFKRAFMVLVSPRRTYESLKAKRSRADWLVPLVLTIICSLLMVNAGFDFIIAEQRVQSIERIQSMDQLTAEQKEAQIDRINESLSGSATGTRILMNASSTIGVVLAVVVIALVLMAIARVMFSVPLPYKDAFTVTALAGMVSVAGIVVQTPLMFLYESLERSQLKLGLLFPAGMSETFLYRMMDIGLFSVLYALMLATGLSVFTRKSLTNALVPLVVLWMLFRLATVGISGMLGIG